MNGHAYFERERERHLSELSELLRIPCVSALSVHASDMLRAAEWLAADCRRVGLSGVEIMETQGHPVVYAEWLGKPGAPTALIYGHYDVQPVDPVHLWETPPFEPSIRGDKLFARGSTDDKGQVFMHLKVLEAILAEQGSLPVNVKLLIEGEEEIGSKHLTPFVQAHREKLACDVVVISDTALWAPGVPSICYSLRGLAALEIHVSGAKGDLHSGVYGGVAPNAARGLAGLLASLYRPDGGVAVDGFYAGVRDLTPAERQSFASLGFDEAALAGEIGVSALPGEPGFTALERIWGRPTLEINGLWGGFQGEGTKTVIPAKAAAKITCRLVANQDPNQVQAAIEAHLQAHCPPGLSVTVKRERAGSPAAIVPIDHPAIRAAAEALAEGYGRETKYIGGGGSIPVVGTFLTELNAPSVLMGFGLESENAHAPNEHFHLENFDRGLRVLHAYWFKLATAMQQ